MSRPMMTKMQMVAAAVVGSVVLCGCSTPETLVQPQRIPVFIRSYKVPFMSAHGTSCSLNLLNCPIEATLVKVSMSGSRSPESKFPIRDIVEAEFAAFIDANLSMVKDAEQPKIEVKVEPQRVILERDGRDVAFNFALAIRLLNPYHEDKPFFSKIYSARTYCRRADDETVPSCVYEAVQRIMADFINDLAADSSLLSRISSL